MHYYRFHSGDYAKATRGLTLLEDLAYRRLLDLYYEQEAPIPADIERVARRIGMREHVRAVEYVLSEFFVQSDTKSEAFYRNFRCDAEISKYQAKAESARRANSARWNSKPTERDLESDTKANAHQIPTNNQEPITSNTCASSDADARFNEFWKVCPKRVDKKRARKTFKHLSKAKQDAAIADYGERYRGVDKQFIPNPSTYLNGERWEDELGAPQAEAMLADYGRGGI